MNNTSFEDSIFIINIRIKMIRDILRLNPPSELFLEKCMDDLVFIDWALSCLGEQCRGENQFDYASDAEWQFSQLLTEFSFESSPFPYQSFPKIGEKVAQLRSSSMARRKTLEESEIPVEMAKAEPLVSSAELSGLLGGF